MIKFTLSRNDHIYECFPDLALTPAGTLVCIYRECLGHAPFPFSRIAVRRSLDGGKNWHARDILTECVVEAQVVEAHRAWLPDDALAGYAETRARITEDWQIGATINCPRLLCLADGTLLLIADITRQGQVVNKAWRSRDGGATWTAPEDLRTEYYGYVPSLTQLRDGRILLGLNIPAQDENAGVCFSNDQGMTWSKMTLITRNEDMQLDEASYVELDDGIIVGFGRNIIAERQHPLGGIGLKVISRDGGKTWDGPFQTRLLGLEGRPKVGRLASGEICMTYRLDLPNELLALRVMTQENAKREKPGNPLERAPMPDKEVAPQFQLLKGQGLASDCSERTIILDCDRSVHRDSGYSGWVQLPSGDILVVDYINDDAPLAHIRGYLVNRSDYILFPEGGLPWLHPGLFPFHKMTLSMAEQQYRQAKRNAGT